jgi:hypothetical protein
MGERSRQNVAFGGVKADRNVRLVTGVRRCPATGEQECDLIVGQKVNLINGMPGRDVIACRSNNEHWCPNIGQRDCFPVNKPATLGQIIVEIKVAQVF